MKIWIDKPEPIEKALDIITDNWIDRGQYCEQTLYDMRDALKQLHSENQRLRDLLEMVANDRIEWADSWKAYAKELLAELEKENK